MRRQELLTKSSGLLARFAFDVRVKNSMGLFDINTMAEDLLIPVFSLVFDCPDLRNQNKIQMNFPAVDLGCSKSRTSLQITSDASSGKALKTIEKFEEHSLGDEFDRLLVYVLTERQKSYSSKKLVDAASGCPIDFNPERDIIDYKDLSHLLSELPDPKLEAVANILESFFAAEDTSRKFRTELNEFLEVSSQKIEDEKRSKKYIPSVFVETTKTKEEMRYFGNPLFFCEKIDDGLAAFNLVEYNRILQLSHMEPIDFDLAATVASPYPNTIPELFARLETQREAIFQMKAHLLPYTHEGKAEKTFGSHDYLSGYWEVFRHSLTYGGMGLVRSLEDIQKRVELANAKIFLITGMAGQGKTNFICDLVENQFRKFEVPTIFIPARRLNDYPGPNRLLSYIANNRYSPEFGDPHELLQLLNAVAADFGKPFIIAIDGINEVGDLDGFVSELRVFLEALCQYDYIKVIISCRSEFFDHKFSGLFEPQFSEFLHRVPDLRSKMSDENKLQLLAAYLGHFKIRGHLSNYAKRVLQDDLILLRIFCDINEDRELGFVPDIYKGEIFERYLMIKVKEFPKDKQQEAISTLYQVCAKMLSMEDFAQIALDGFSAEQRQTIDSFVGEDIILRREVPPTGLSSLGLSNISFTYDEMRDFLLAHFVISQLSKNDPDAVTNIFGDIKKWPIYEGFFRYAYILARKEHDDHVMALCEANDDFLTHYLNNLSVLSPEIQSETDVLRVREALIRPASDRDLRRMFWFLFRKRVLTDPLNIQLLLDHLADLDDPQLEAFVKAAFSRTESYRDDEWRDQVSSLLSSLLSLSLEEQIGVGDAALAVSLFSVPFARWDEREAVKNLFSQNLGTPEFSSALDRCANAVSLCVKECLAEVADGAGSS
ncbi:SMEK domain-containing protein [Roseobacter sp. HKCCD9010]|uniref:SMEK domain-containing protein n=1 Tax=unclassified Roseobacter TaxID=196798 RepID=UPI001491D128|nr:MULTISPECIES: SMEK domain-containing protein [unclassified Roseobacter]MBF9052397.1 SMEK domain-containing protein [Rhodobacterales bacterium HKCCD4356]NNV14386.1 SMEK domain-containing protein [Roseobacter sp. HKCCD7357]NNV18564.1 SMEK domain-containing protein [Roseobacter sp. HKCCD8768]NNV28079.1 SMEK domain-containing protein [Roseobacter sp. HKCCD8192]NNV32329.1 SMEK domain-containing protein [Roseobacter sp. HKCCD9061]